MKKSLLRAAIVHGNKVVAADGAVKVVLRAGLQPEAVIGDFDSISGAVRAVVPASRLHRIDEQDSTDFEKCLSHIAAPLVIGVGFMGGRLDHQLAVLHGMLRFAARPCLLLGKRDIAFLAPPELRLKLPEGSRVSLYPLVGVKARSEGLHWPLQGVGFGPEARIGTSNRVAAGAEEVWIGVDRPGMLVILPAGRLAAAVEALAAPGAPRWGVR